MTLAACGTTYQDDASELFSDIPSKRRSRCKSGFYCPSLECRGGLGEKTSINIREQYKVSPRMHSG